MKDTERYLKAATKGLWGQERRALRTELAGHIQIRTNELMLTGLSESAAEREALRELGAPGQVSRGMAAVHTLSSAVKGSLATALMALALLSGVQQSQAQVKSIYGSIDGVGAAGGYLNFKQFQAELEKAGAKFLPATDEGYVGHIVLPDAPRSDYQIPAWPGAMLSVNGQTFIQSSTLIATLLNMGTNLHLNGWNNPTLTAGKTTLHLETTDPRVLSDLYAATLWSASNLTTQYNTPLNTLPPEATSHEATLKNQLIQPKHIYALVTPQSGKWWSSAGDNGALMSGTVTLAASIIQAQTAGQATFRISPEATPYKLFKSVDLFQTALDPYRNSPGRWDAKNPAPALLLELTGDFGQDAYKVVPPQAFK